MLLHVNLVLFGLVAFLAFGAYSAIIIDEHTKSFRTGQDFIFGGAEARPGQFPHQASVRELLPNNKFVHMCGGSIITNRFIVSAGHCYPDPEDRDNLTANFHLVLGAQYRSVENDGIVYQIEKVFVHPGWDIYTIKHDISLTQTVDVIEFTAFIRPIPISRQFINSTVRAVISGWGRNDNSNPAHPLRYLAVYTLKNKECRDRYPWKPPVNDYSTICAYSGRFGDGICSGDSGGPLIFKGELIAQVSWGYRCGRGYPDGYNRVSEYVTWIEEQIASTGTEPLLKSALP